MDAAIIGAPVSSGTIAVAISGAPEGALGGISVSAGFAPVVTGEAAAGNTRADGIDSLGMNPARSTSVRVTAGARREIPIPAKTTRNSAVELDTKNEKRKAHKESRPSNISRPAFSYTILLPIPLFRGLFALLLPTSNRQMTRVWMAGDGARHAKRIGTASIAASCRASASRHRAFR
jgi:hypothetical protein